MNNSHQGHIARKRFGQNFLHDQGVIDQIVYAISPQTGQTLVEIGPGLGALTTPVAMQCGLLNVIELDRDLAERLRHHSELSDKLYIIEQDALKFDFSTLFKNNELLRVFGNLPYNISTPLLFHLFKYIDKVQDMHFMLQKEVVKRMAADPGSKTFGKLSVMTQYYCHVQSVIEVPPTAFNPPPKVQSAVVRLTPHQKRPYPETNVTILNQVCAAAFGQRRKTLRNSLKKIVSESQLESLKIDPAARPETLSVTDFCRIAHLVGSVEN